VVVPTPPPRGRGHVSSVHWLCGNDGVDLRELAVELVHLVNFSLVARREQRL
jgi:hypothetical protein